jgi:hypothetical protein
LVYRQEDLISIALATIAIGLSFATALSNRRLRREQAFLRIHEMLITPDLQAGRKLLFEHAERGSFPDNATDDWKMINHAVSAYNTLAMYIAHGIIPKTLALAHWHHPLRDVKHAAELFRDEREQQYDRRPFAYLDDLLEQAIRHRSGLRCCRRTHRPSAQPLADAE